MSLAAKALEAILVRSADVPLMDASILEELDRWLDDACEEFGDSQDVSGIISTCSRAYKEMFPERRSDEFEKYAHIFRSLSISVARQRCVAFILTYPLGDPSTKVGRGAERIFDFMEEAGCFPEDFVE